MATLTITKKDGTLAEVSAEPLQVPAKKWGDHTLTPNQLPNLQVDAFGRSPVQVIPLRQGGSISPPPSKNFR